MKEITERMRQAVVHRYGLGEEIFSSISHGIGVLLGVAATVLLIVRAVHHATPGRVGASVTSMSIFGATFLVLYLMSTLYHALTPYGAKRVFSVLDHTSIYLLIAGTYTPFCLAVLGGALGWTLFGLIWGFAVLGILLYSIFERRFPKLNLATYIGMGWVVIFAIRPLKAAICTTSFTFLWVGGLAYALGCAFYAAKRYPWTHAIWHLFVLAGSICHFFSIYFSLPVAPS
jgi:hemolysin III